MPEVLTDALQLKPGSHVLILGGYGVRNVGDEAILAGMLNQLPGGVEASVVSRAPRETRRMHGVRSVTPPAAVTELLRSDVLIVGGGGLFSGDTGPFGRLIPAFTRVALTAGKRVAFHGLGVYPSASASLMRELARVAGRLESLTVRDRLSFDTLSRQGIASVIIPDLSESMTDLAQNERPILTDLLGLDPARPTVCLCLTAINPELSAFLLDSLAESMASRPEIQFCFIPMSQHPTEERHNDLTFARQLQALWPDLRVLEGWFRPAEYLALIGQADAVVCSRFHSFLFAHRMHRPIIALPYSAKCDAWLEDHGMNSTPRTVGAIQDRLTELLSEKRAVAV